MDAAKVRKAINSDEYEVREGSDCGCSIRWEIERGELVCNVYSDDACYTSQVLVIDGEDVAEYVRYEGLQRYEVDDYPDDYDGEDDEDSLKDDVRDLIRMGEMTERGDDPNGPAHAEKVADALKDYIETLEADGWTLYRDNVRGFANEYDCILVAPNAGQDEINDDWDELDVETWCKEYLYDGDAITEAYNGIRVIE